MIPTLKRMNALTYEQSKALTKLVHREPISPKSMNVLNELFK